MATDRITTLQGAPAMMGRRDKRREGGRDKRREGRRGGGREREEEGTKLDIIQVR